MCGEGEREKERFQRPVHKEDLCVLVLILTASTGLENLPPVMIHQYEKDQNWFIREDTGETQLHYQNSR